MELDFIRISSAPEAPPEIEAETFLMDKAINRAKRPSALIAKLRNTGGDGNDLSARVILPEGVSAKGPSELKIASFAHGEVKELSWTIEADAATSEEITLVVSDGGMTEARAAVPVRFTEPVSLPKAPYVPEPEVAKSEYLVGAHYCPLWKEGTRNSGWGLIVPFPKRKPALGWYNEGSPEVADWEIKWCLEHGISFFVYCWYRRDQGNGVKMYLEHAIHEGLFNAKYRDKFKFCTMWTNQVQGVGGVASEEDLLDNLLPFWIENYFKHPSYLKVDNKPLLFIYRPEYLVNDLGSVANVRRALGKVRAACRDAGFDGLTILGEYRGTNVSRLQLMVDEGLDASFAYCWPVPNDPAPGQAIRAQEEFWRHRREHNILPEVLTLSMGWDSTPWHPSHSKWRLPPGDFKTLCEKAKTMMATFPSDSLSGKVALLDNWNELGEGHYIAPHREYGFGYLDAVRSAFTDAPEKHVDLIPEDVGLGPYDSLFRKVREMTALCSKKVVREGKVEPGLIAWWTFDEDDDAPVAWDYSGNGLGGRLHDAARADGVRGKALACAGGSVAVPANAMLTPPKQITVECWLRTAAAEQNGWFVNRIFGDGASGYRFGLQDGQLCWAIPKTSWSHHLRGNNALPLGRWVHVAGTYDGKTMRIYMDGKECGSMERGGRLYPSDYPLVLGNYAVGHKAFFNGVLDEVKLYDRALTAEQVRDHARER